MTVMEALKAATSEQHKQLEAVSDSQRILSPDLSVAHFCGLMLGHYYLHDLLEAPITSVLDAQLPELGYGSQRQKMSLLTQDLLALHVDPAQTQTKLESLPIPDLASALGVAYVLEGSTLGGTVIRRALLKHGKLSALCDFKYYNCYGEALRERWLSFAQMVNQTLLDPQAQAQACASAQAAFELATAVFSQTLQNQERYAA